MKRLWLLACGLSAASGSALAAPSSPGLVEVVDGFENLQVANESAPVTNMRLTSGHLECLLASGRASLVKAGEEAVGLFFEGNGTMEYLSADPIEAPVVTFVSKKASSLKPEKTDKGIRLRDRFTRLLWVVAGEKVPELQGLAPRPLTASFREQREKFRHSLGSPLSYGFALQKIDAPHAPLVWAEMDGGSESLVYVRGGMENPYEALRVLRSSESSDPQFRDSLRPITLSRQPVGWDRRDPPHPRFLLTDVDLQVTASDGKDVALTVVETLVPQKEAQSVFRFDLDSTVYAYFGANLTTRTERVRKVTDEAGRSLGFYHENNELLVRLAEPVAPDRPVKVRFDIDGDFLVHPGGDSYWALGVWSWFPQPEFCEQYYTFHAVVRVKKPFVPFASGTTIRRGEEGDDNVLETTVDKPIQFAVILAGSYDFKEEVRNGIKIRVATYALKNPRAMKQLADLAASIIGFYTEFLGPFPFEEFNIIEINAYGFGQAPPGVMFITKEAFSPLSDEAAQLYSGGVNERFAHEIAHQYWAHAVKMPSLEEEWISESFAEYSAALFVRAARGEAEYKSLVAHWKGRANFATDAAPIPLANRVFVAKDPRTRWAIRTGLLYGKGPLLLASLQRQLGDEAFLTFLKSFQKSFRWKFGSTKMMAALLQFMTKKDFGPFFEANYWGTGMPKD